MVPKTPYSCIFRLEFEKKYIDMFEMSTLKFWAKTKNLEFRTQIA